MSEKKCCQYCDDGNGDSIYPYYGVAPHNCNGWDSIGTATELPRSDWPSNFRPDPEATKGTGQYPGAGVYTHCMECGAKAYDDKDLTFIQVKQANKEQ